MPDLMNLASREVAAKTVKYGSYTFDVPVGKTLKIETSPQGLDVLIEAVPAGKTWSVTVTVEIQETTA